MVSMNEKPRSIGDAFIIALIITFIMCLFAFPKFYHWEASKKTSNDPRVVAIWRSDHRRVCLTKKKLEFNECMKNGGKVLLGVKTSAPNEDARFMQAALRESLTEVTDIKDGRYDFLASIKAPPKNKALTCYGRKTETDCTWDGSKFHFSDPK